MDTDVKEQAQDIEINNAPEQSSNETQAQPASTSFTYKGQTFNNLEEFQKKFDDMERGFTSARQELSQIKKAQSNTSTQTPSNANPSTGSANQSLDYDEAEIERAKRNLLAKGMTDTNTARQIAEEIVSQKMMESTNRMNVDTFLKEHNANSRSNSVKIDTTADKERFYDLYANRGISLEDALYALRGKEMIKQAIDDNKNFNPRQMRTGQSGLASGVSDDLQIKKEEVTEENFGNVFDKVWAQMGGE